MRSYRLLGAVFVLTLLILPGGGAGVSVRPGKAALAMAQEDVVAMAAANDAIYADSCSQADVQAAIDAASDGDVVIIPAGHCMWTGEVNCDKGITLQGMGIGVTVITYTGTLKALWVRRAPTNQFRLTGITWSGNHAHGCVALRGEMHGFRVDHNRFVGCVRALELEGYLDGVIDHNEFENCTSDVTVLGDDTDAWSRPIVLGGSDGVVFIEDNTFTYTSEAVLTSTGHSVTSNRGGRYVFRHNTIDALDYYPLYLHAPIDAHGYCFYGRGTVSYEVYGNTLKSHRSWRGMFLRGGTGVVFDNTFVGDADPNDVDWPNPIHLTNYRSCRACSGTGVTPPTCEEGYPCQDQIHDLYIWDNWLDGELVPVKVDSILCDGNEMNNYIQEGRDYFLYEKPGYVPYVYPHPLTWELTLHGVPADEAIHLGWIVNTTLPVTATWHIDYYTQTAHIYTATEPLSVTRSTVLTEHVDNYQWYTVTLHAVDGGTSILSDTVRAMPTDRFVYLPLVLR